MKTQWPTLANAARRTGAALLRARVLVPATLALVALGVLEAHEVSAFCASWSNNLGPLSLPSLSLE